MSFDPNAKIDRGGQIIPGAPYGRPAPAWEDVEPGWGQGPGLRTIQWGGAAAEFDVQISDAPVVVERIDHPNRPRPGNHGGHNQ